MGANPWFHVLSRRDFRRSRCHPGLASSPAWAFGPCLLLFVTRSRSLCRPRLATPLPPGATPANYSETFPCYAPASAGRSIAVGRLHTPRASPTNSAFPLSGISPARRSKAARLPTLVVLPALLQPTTGAYMAHTTLPRSIRSGCRYRLELSLTHRSCLRWCPGTRISLRAGHLACDSDAVIADSLSPPAGPRLYSSEHPRGGIFALSYRPGPCAFRALPLLPE